MNPTLIFIAMVFAAFLGSTGQIFLKIGSGKTALIQMLPWLFAFAAVYGVAVLINLWAYKVGGKVTFVYPIISLSYAITAFLAWKFLGEPINTSIVGGTLLIIGGIALIGFGSQVT
jgi:uncharacterized membrane protein